MSTFKKFIENNKKLKILGNLLFYHKALVTWNKKQLHSYVTFFENGLSLVNDRLEIKDVVYFERLEVRIKENALRLKWMSDKRNVLKIPFDDVNLLESYYENIKTRIKNSNKKEKNNSEYKRESEVEFPPSLEGMDVNKTKKLSNYTINFNSEHLVPTKVIFGDVLFFIMFDINQGLKGLRKEVLYRVAEFFYPTKKLRKNMIDLTIFKSLKFFLKHEEQLIVLEKEQDLEAGIKYLNNKLDIVIKK